MSNYFESRFRVGIIGPGRVGVAMGISLQNAGHIVKVVSAVSDRSKLRAEKYFPYAELVDPIEIVEKCDLLFIAVPDDQLTALVAGICKQTSFRKGQIVMHPSGAHGLVPLLPAIDQGAIGLALHPAMPFEGDATDVDQVEESPFGVTCAEEHRVIAEGLVYEMGGVPIWIDDADRDKYHAAICHASNHLVTLITQSMQLLDEIGNPDSGAYVQHLVHLAAERAIHYGPKGLTGPIMRGDVNTVQIHLDALSPGEFRDSYKEMAKHTVETAIKGKWITAQQAEAFYEVLK